MLDPLDNKADGVRLSLLPVDCPREPLTRVIRTSVKEICADRRPFEEYMRNALKNIVGPVMRPSVSRAYQLASFAAIGAVRVQMADPLSGTGYEKREVHNSAEQRMVRQPFKKHPGITRLTSDLRDYYLATTLGCFYEILGPKLQSEIASVILTPNYDDQSGRKAGLYCSPSAIPKEFQSQLEVVNEGIRLTSADSVTECCRLPAQSQSQVGWSTVSKPYFDINGFVLPHDVFKAKFREYAWHSWMKLVNTAYLELYPQYAQRIIDATPAVETMISKPLEYNSSIYTPEYTVDNTTNPKQEYEHRFNNSYPSTSLTIQDKRLISAVDCIRAKKDLEFDEWIPVDILFDQLTTFFPAPGRPGNDTRNIETLTNALEGASEVKFRSKTGDTTIRHFCSIPEPHLSPYYSTKTSTNTGIWDQYLALRTERSKVQLSPPDNLSLTGVSQSRYNIDPISPYGSNRPEWTWHSYQRVLAKAERGAVAVPHGATYIDDVELPYESVLPDTLTEDEYLFVSQVGLAMERLLLDHSLTTSMQTLRERKNKSELSVDIDSLIERGWIEEHPEGRSALYTVPAARRSELGIPNISHDGFGEQTSKEKSLHRRGVDRTAATIAALPDVTRVVRYCDLWRLLPTQCESVIQSNNLNSRRADVIGFDGKTPKYLAEIETASNDQSKSRSSIDLLDAFTGALSTIFVVPNSDHMWKIFRHLDHPEYFDFDSFPDSSPDKYSPSAWKTKLRREGVLGTSFDRLETYRSLDDPKIDPLRDERREKIVGLPASARLSRSVVLQAFTDG